MRITSKKLLAILFWLVSFTPLFLILLTKFLAAEIKPKPESLFYKLLRHLNIFNLHFHIFIQIILYITVVMFSIILYKVFLTMYLKRQRKKIHNSEQFKQTKIVSFTSLSFEHYSYFILTLLFPFIFLDSNKVFDFLLIISLIIIVIYILVKTNKIAINPIFLFSNLNVFDAKVRGNSGKTIDVKIVTDLSKRELEESKKLPYSEYFDDLYIILKKK